MTIAEYIPYLQQRIAFISDFLGSYQDSVSFKGKRYSLAVPASRTPTAYSQWVERMDRFISAVCQGSQIPMRITYKGKVYDIDETPEQTEENYQRELLRWYRSEQRKAAPRSPQRLGKDPN